MSGVKAFLWLAFVMVATVTVLSAVYWFVHHGAAMFVDHTP